MPNQEGGGKDRCFSSGKRWRWKDKNDHKASLPSDDENSIPS
jgi:hypothetical protein